MFSCRRTMVRYVGLGVAAFMVFNSVQDARLAQAEGTNGLIAFVGAGPQFSIYSIDPSRGILTRLTNGEDYRPRWSPDGTRIVFQRYSPNSIHSDIYVVNANGSDVQRLTHLGTAFHRMVPGWLQDRVREHRLRWPLGYLRDERGWDRPDTADARPVR